MNLTALLCLLGLGITNGLAVNDEVYDYVSKSVIGGILDSFDPFIINEDFALDLKEIKAKVSLKNVIVTGLSELHVENVSVDIVNGVASASLTLPKISAEGKYDVDGTLSASGLTLPLQGDGAITFGFEGMELEASIQLGISDKGQILLENFNLIWNMTNIRLQLDGLYGGTALGKMINKILADILPRLVLKTYHKQITNLITSVAMDKGGAFLKSIHEDHGTPPPDDDQRTIVAQHAAEDKAKGVEALISLFAAAPNREREAERDEPVPAGDRDSFEPLISLALDLAGSEEFQQPLRSLLSLVSSVQGDQADAVSFSLEGEPSFFQHGELSDLEEGESLDVGFNFGLGETKLSPWGTLV